ncbi:MAG: tetratricopeptide repeat protein, partial [Pyrinomonadaceae bacterium]|nr:tetratricopeptide repeat protein [Pyrinomonadaceae bacterium]
GEKRVREVATKLEQFRHTFTRLFPNMSYKSPIPTSVVVFKNKGSFKRYKNIKWAAGYFQPGEDINYIALHTGGDRRYLYTTIFHEYIHFLVNNNVGKSVMPPWFGEGIAEYYDQFKIKDDRIVTLGSPNGSHLQSLQRSRLIPFDTFFNIDHYSLQQQGSHSANIFYAQSWALMHFLIKGNGGARNDQLTSFMGMLMRGIDPKEAFSQAFKTDYTSMEKELRKYVRKSRYGITTVTFKKKLLFEDAMQTTPLTEAESKAHLGDLLFAIRKYEDAEKLLKESLALDPGQSFANATMGMLKLRQDKYSEARGYLENALKTENSNYRIYYQYANVLSREGRTEGSFMDSFSSENAAKIRAALKKAITLNPSFPRSYDLMARVSLMTGENIDEGIGYLRKAITLSPGNQWYMLNLANLYMRKREFDKAIPVVEAVSRSADEPQLRSYARRLLEDLRRIQGQMNASRNEGFRTGDGEKKPPKLGRRTTTVISSDDEEPSESEQEFLIRGINNSLRPLGNGEARTLGTLTKISCKRGNITFIIKADSGEIRLTSNDFQSLRIMAYTNVGNLQIGCGTIKQELFGVFSYKVAGNGKSKLAGELVAIELVPKGFKIIGRK